MQKLFLFLSSAPAGDFDYSSDFLNNGTIANTYNLHMALAMTTQPVICCTWGANDILTVSGSADITTNNYTQYGAINVAGVLTINANNYTYDRPNSDFVLAENDSLSILGDFTIAANNYIQFGTLEVSGDLNIDAESNFFNSGAITTESLNITTGYTAINQGSIVSVV